MLFMYNVYYTKRDYKDRSRVLRNKTSSVICILVNMPPIDIQFNNTIGKLWKINIFTTYNNRI